MWKFLLLDTGLKVTIMGAFEASLESSHSGSKDLLESFKIGQKLKFRILWVDQLSKHIGLTVLDHLLKWKPIQIPFSIGEIFEKVKVLRVDQKVGLLVEWKDNQLGYVHVSFVIIF